MLFSRINPFIWDKTVDDVNSPVISFDVNPCRSGQKERKGRNRRKRSADDSDSIQIDYGVELAMNQEQQEPLLVNETVENKHGKSI